jgi:hypothetical protein
MKMIGTRKFGSYHVFQMPEEQAFCVLVKVMFDYGQRELFRQGFEMLHLKFYQLERLMQVGIYTLHLFLHTKICFKPYGLPTSLPFVLAGLQ